MNRDAQVKAMWAQLINVYHYHPDQIARLTDRQIVDLCFHPRDDDGSISAREDLTPREPKSMVEELIQWDKICFQFAVKPEKREEGRAKIKAKWAAKEDSGHGT